MKAEDLYDKLQRLDELEKIISAKGKVEVGDADFIKYNRLVGGLQILSLDDVRKFYHFLIGEDGKSEGRIKEQVAGLKNEILAVLEEICPPNAYDVLKSAIEQAHAAYVKSTVTNLNK